MYYWAVKRGIRRQLSDLPGFPFNTFCQINCSPDFPPSELMLPYNRASCDIPPSPQSTTKPVWKSLKDSSTSSDLTEAWSVVRHQHSDDVLSPQLIFHCMYVFSLYLFSFPPADFSSVRLCWLIQKLDLISFIRGKWAEQTWAVFSTKCHGGSCSQTHKPQT